MKLPDYQGNEGQATLCPGIMPLVEEIRNCVEFGLQCPSISDLRNGSHRFASVLRFYKNTSIVFELTKFLPKIHCRTDATKAENDGIQNPPDFVLNDEHFEDEFCEKFLALPTWTDYDSNNAAALKDLLMDMLKEFKEYQIRQMGQIDRLKLEIDFMRNEDANFHEYWEFFLKDGTTAYFVRELNIFTAEDHLPAHVYELCPKIDTVVFRAIMQGNDFDNVSFEILHSKELVSLLGNDAFSFMNNVHAADERFLSEIAKEIEDSLQDSVTTYLDAYDKRKQLVCAMLAFWTNQVIDVDDLNFKYITVLFEIRDFCFIVRVSFGEKFFTGEAGGDPVKLSFHSIYHETRNSARPSPYALSKDLKFTDKFLVPEKFISRLIENIEAVFNDFQRNSSLHI